MRFPNAHSTIYLAISVVWESVPGCHTFMVDRVFGESLSVPNGGVRQQEEPSKTEEGAN